MSFQIKIFRSGLEHNPNGPNDPGVLAGKAIIDKVSTTSTDANIVQNTTAAFETEFGSGTVTVRTAPMRYEWVWNEEHQIWTFICLGANGLTINDGGTEPLMVLIDLTT